MSSTFLVISFARYKDIVCKGVPVPPLTQLFPLFKTLVSPLLFSVLPPFKGSQTVPHTVTQLPPALIDTPTFLTHN